MNDEHDPEQLTAYALGLLDGEDARAMEAHVVGCPRCHAELMELREIDDALRRVPPELFLDGPPQGGELVLRRTLRQIRQDSGASWKRRRLTLVVAVVAALVSVGAVGVAFGRGAASESIIAAPKKLPVRGSRLLTGVAPSTGVRMTVIVTPAAGLVRIKATVVGIPAGERCTLVVVDRSRDRYIVASWLVSPAGEKGTVVDGAAVVRPEDVTAVEVQHVGGREVVSAAA